MKVFLIWVNDENFYRLLPEDLGGSKPGDARIKVMGFPPLGIETLAPVLRQHGHTVRMFDTCHPEMKEPDIAQALRDDQPDVVALSFLSTTTYPGVKSMAQVVKGVMPNVPVIVGGVFATMNQDRILKDCPFIDAVGVGEGEELLPDYLDNLNSQGKVAGLTYGTRLYIAVTAEETHEFLVIHSVSNVCVELGLHNRVPRWHALQKCVHRRHHNGRLCVRLAPRQCG